MNWQSSKARSRSKLILHARGSAANCGYPSPERWQIARDRRSDKLARDAADDGEPLIFAGCAQLGHRLELPVRGMELRHTYATIAAACKIPELDRHFLMGHAPDGISKKYVLRLQAASGPSMREAQRKISKRIMELLGEPLASRVRAPALSPDGPQDTEAAPLARV